MKTIAAKEMFDDSTSFRTSNSFVQISQMENRISRFGLDLPSEKTPTGLVSESQSDANDDFQVFQSPRDVRNEEPNEAAEDTKLDFDQEKSTFGSTLPGFSVIFDKVGVAARPKKEDLASLKAEGCDKMSSDASASNLRSGIPEDPKEPQGGQTVSKPNTEPPSSRTGPNCDINTPNHQLDTAIAKLAAYLNKTSFCPQGPANFNGWGLHWSLRLRGGAGVGGVATETSGSSGWGSGGASGGAGANPPPAWNQPPPTSSASGGAQGGGQWGQQANAGPVGPPSGPNSSSGATSWAQAAGKGLPGGSGTSSTSSAPGPGPASGGSAGQSSASGSSSNGAGVAGGASQGPAVADSQQQKRELEKIREALWATDGWGGNHVNQDTEWNVPPSPPRSPNTESHSWRPSNTSTGTEIWENNLRNGGMAANRPPDPTTTAKTPWGRERSNEFGGQWDPEDDSADNSNWNAPPPGNQWTGGATGGGWAPKDKSGVDWSNPGGSNSSGPGPWDQRAQGPAPNRWGPGVKPPTAGMPVGTPWGGKSGWGDENTPPAKGMDDGTTPWGEPNGMRKKEQFGARMPGPGLRMPPSVRPPGHRGWGDDSNAETSGTGGWGMPPSSPPGAGSAGWGQKPKTLGWGDPSDMMDQSTGWSKPKSHGGNNGLTNWNGPNWPSEGQDQWNNQQRMPKPQAKPMGKDMWKSPYGMYKDEQNMGMSRDMDEMQHGYPGRDSTDAMGMPPGGSGPGGWPPTGTGRLDDHRAAAAAAGFGATPTSPYDIGGSLGGSMMHGPPGGMNRGGGFPAQMQPGMQPFMQQRPGVRPTPPTSQQLSLLVNQIHMAVQAGHLNPQILNQKLSSQTLVLLNELLNQIKVLQSLTQQQQTFMQQGGHMRGSHNPAMLQISVKITQTKQQIQNLQNQINAQQGIFTKQQQQQAQQQQHGVNPSASMMGAAADGYAKMMGHSGLGLSLGNAPGAHDGSFASMMGSMNLNPAGHDGPSIDQAMTVPPPAPPATSRFFNKWQLGDERANDESEFSRAPGTLPSSSTTNSTAGMLGAPSDGTWAAPTSKVDGGWPEAANTSQAQTSNTAWSNATSTSSASNYNMPDVPEFEPGKPWKGNQLLKNIEDDPNITPGSVKRSALSVATLKEPEMKPPSSNSDATNNGSKSSNGVANGPAGGSGLGFNNSAWSYPARSSNTWLVLNNLGPSMDTSTLKTLCMQHGPINSFHMAHGMALVRYNTYEEAAKAQSGLNNCVIGSTSLRADFVADAEVQAYLGSAANQQVQQMPQTSWSNATTSHASSLSRSHESAWSQPALSTWSGAGGNPSALWDSPGGADQAHPYLPDNLI